MCTVLGMLRIGERRLVMLTMLQMESRLAKGDDPSLNAKVSTFICCTDLLVLG